MSLVIFDLDETLLAGDSCSLFCEYLVSEGIAPPEFVDEDAQMMVRYHAQTLVLDDYVHFLIKPLKKLSVSDIDALMVKFVDTYIVPNLYPEALLLLKEYQQQAVRILIISATCEFIVKAIGAVLGVHDVLAIQLKIKDDTYSGKILGVPTFREGKITRLSHWLTQHQQSIDNATFYSDSINDLPLLEMIDNPIATNPDHMLMAIAARRHWPILQWTAPNGDVAR